MQHTSNYPGSRSFNVFLEHWNNVNEAYKNGSKAVLLMAKVLCQKVCKIPAPSTDKREEIVISLLNKIFQEEKRTDQNINNYVQNLQYLLLPRGIEDILIFPDLAIIGESIFYTEWSNYLYLKSRWFLPSNSSTE